MSETSQPVSPATVEPPRGTRSARVDDKGRLKLPTAMAQYLEAIGERKVFITSLNVSTALIYPISVWRETESFLSQGGEQAEALAHVAMVANHYGEDAELDTQGRVLLPSTLRQDLGLEKDDVYLWFYKGRIEVFGSKVYAERFGRAKEGLQEKVAELEKLGLR